MTLEQQRNVFRLAAIVYGRSAKGVSLTKSYQKIVDDALFCCGKESISLTELILYIKTNYGFLYTPKEIKDLVSGRDAKEKYQTYPDQNEWIISLTVEYKNKLTLICQEKTLYDFIDEYFSKHEGDKEIGKELILRFLYDMFTSNLEGYKLILQEKYDAVAASANFNDEEKTVINGFLDWPDDGKNKAVFDLAGYALEYCMMTNKKNTSLNTQNLKNKSFYIDTNILYRAIGLNGDGFKTRAHLFLSKFREVGENLMVSQSTFVEFSDSVDYYIGKIDKSQRPQVNTNVLKEFIDEDSIYLYYCKWRVGRVNRDASYFKDWIMSEFNSLCDLYEIKREIKYPYDIEQRRKELDEMATSIYQYDTDKSITSAGYDAENVLWVEEKRKGSGDDIYQAKAFMLSSDNSLRRWDYQRNTNRVPIVMSPGQWLGIILHYVERTSDDYKSFVSFLTLNVRHEVLPIEKLSLIIMGISQTTSDIETQKYLVRNFIERKTFEGVELMNDDELEKDAEEFAKTELEKRIANLEARQRKSEKELATTKKNLSVTQSTLSKLRSSHAERFEENEFRIKKEEEMKQEAINESKKLKELINKQELKHWRFKFVVLWTFIALVSVMIGLMMFLWIDADWNFVAKFVAFVDTRKDSSASKVGESAVLIPVVAFGYAVRMIIKVFKVKVYNSDDCGYLWLK